MSNDNVTMTKEEAKERIRELSKEVEKHNYLYYMLNQPEISDKEFDMMMRELEELEEQYPEFADPNSPTKRVGGDITKKFQTVRHKYPMLSLSNSYSKEEVADFIKRIRKTIGDGNLEFACEMKYDGVAVSIRYVNGILDRAVTRGDGEKGEDITTNIKTIKTVPLHLRGDYPDDFEIRGEVFMPISAFAELNKQKEKAGEPLLANPRNTAAGTLKLQDSSVVAKRRLDCFLYSLHGEDLPFQSHFENMLKAAEWGFKIPYPEKRYIAKCKDIDGIMAFIEYWDKERVHLDFEIDGVVIKVNDYVLQEKLGSTAKSPRWAIAFKFETEQAITILDSISFQVGRTGAITPVANLKPVLLGGTTVKRASLHNEDQIKKLDIRIGDTVFVEKGGEIIPKIVGVDKASREPEAKPVEYIENCPVCGTKLIKQEDGAVHYCPNIRGCPPQIKGRIQHFVSRKAMDIDGFGSETVEALYEEGYVRDVTDIYRLQKEDLLKLERWAEKSADNLLRGIEASKNQPFERVLYALGIRYVGETVAKKLARHFKNIENLINASYEELLATEEIGEKMAQTIHDYFDNPQHLEIIQELKEAGLRFSVSQEEEEGVSEKLKGQTFVVSGVFHRFSRDDLKKAIELNGGKNVSAVSGNTDYLIAGENMGPSKKEKAEKLGVKIISEEEFVKMIE